MYYAEIIESSLSTATALCWQWDQMPSFGSLVQIEHEETIIIGLVTGLTTGSSDPARIPFAYQKTAQELQQEQPQLFLFLRTLVTMQLVGWMVKKEGKINYTLPDQPPLMHAFVAQASDVLCQRFLANADFLYCMQYGQGPLFDEALLKLLSTGLHKKHIDTQHIATVVRAYGRFVGTDFRRMRTFCSRLEQSL